MTADTSLSNGQQLAANGRTGATPGGAAGVDQAVTATASPAGYRRRRRHRSGPAMAEDSGCRSIRRRRSTRPRQREKQAFLAQPGDTTKVSPTISDAALRDPSSPYPASLAGTAIPAVMVGGMNSDMPGMVVGQVAENVYDTAAGNYVLVPQGARLIGQYDNSVSQGQTRIGVIWNRVIYPDAESIDLGSMEGADQGGYAGFHDLVNTHFWSKFGNALLISIAAAGVQLSQPQAVNGPELQFPADRRGVAGSAVRRAGAGIRARRAVHPEHARNPARVSVCGDGQQRHAPAALRRSPHDECSHRRQ